MSTALPFAAFGTLNTEAWIIFAIAGFLALCGAISFLIANNLESERRTRHTVALMANEANGQRTVREQAGEVGLRHLEWPDETPPEEPPDGES